MFSFVHLFIHSLIHLFIYLLVNSDGASVVLKLAGTEKIIMT